MSADGSVSLAADVVSAGALEVDDSAVEVFIAVVSAVVSTVVVVVVETVEAVDVVVTAGTDAERSDENGITT